jgi:hypothetical protein
MASSPSRPAGRSRPSWTSAGTPSAAAAFWGHGPRTCPGAYSMRGILLWAIGIPIPVIILLYLFNVL